MGKPTLQSLAAELGVSRQTVSNVLNSPEKVHPRTRDRVLEAIRRSGYRPSVAARALRRQRSMCIGMRLAPISDGINGAVMDGFLHALVEQADGRGYSIVLYPADSVSDELRQLIQLRDSNAIDGAVLTDTHPKDPRPATLAEIGLPVTAFGRPWDSDGDHAWVDVDSRVGTMAATRHLIGLGYENIGFIGWPESPGVGADRRAGWEAARPDTGGDDLAIAVLDTVANGAAAMKELLARGVQAAVCASDSLALGALTELNKGGRKGAVVGYDDTPVARAIGLSSVHQPIGAVAKAVLDLLIGQIEGLPAERSQLLLPPRFIPRDVADFLS